MQTQYVISIMLCLNFAIAGCGPKGLSVRNAPTDEKEAHYLETPEMHKEDPNKPQEITPTEEPPPTTTAPTELEPPPLEEPTVTEPTEQKNPEKKPAKPTKPPVTEPTPVKPAPTLENPLSSLFNFFPLLWEKTVGSAKAWTQMIYTVIKKEETILLGQNIARDIEIFCPTYRQLNEAQRLNFWGQFFAALAYHESGWNPLSRYVEPNFSNPDSVTKLPVVSEGLLQLSYQDELSYRLDCGFDWDKDKKLSTKDPKRTILDPYLNLRCGIKIMSRQLKKYGRIALTQNVYWAVLNPNGRYNKIPQISKATRSMSICKP